MKAIIIKGESPLVEAVEIEPGLKAMQDIVGGNIEYIPFRLTAGENVTKEIPSLPNKPIHLELSGWVNEEGKLQSKPQLNIVATRVMRFLGGIHEDDIIVGPLLLTGQNGDECDSVPDEAQPVLEIVVPDILLNDLLDILSHGLNERGVK